MKREKVAAAVVLAVFGLAQQADAANLLVNGGFETPVQGAPDYATFNIPAGNTTITGWNVVQGNVDLTTTANYGPLTNTLDPASKQDIDLIGDSGGSNGVFGGLSQSFATVVGQTYLLTFDYSHNNGTYSYDYAAQVTVADANAPANTVLSTEVSQLYGASPWVLFSQTFVANSTMSKLSIIDTRGAYNAGVYLDDVSVDAVASGGSPSAVPEPSMWGIMVLGVGLTGAVMRRRKNKCRTMSFA